MSGVIQTGAPADAATCHAQAEQLEAQGRIQPAAELYGRAIALDPAFVPARFARGRLRLSAGEAAAAIVDFEEVLRLAPQHAAALLLMGNAWDARGERARALACFEKAVSIDPAHAEAHYNAGVIHYQNGDFEAAVESNRRAIALDHAPLMAWSNLGLSLLAIGDDAGAEVAYDAAIAKAPSDPSAHWNKALLCLRQGDLARGWPLYEWRWAAGQAGVPVRHYPGRPLWLGGANVAGQRLLVHAEQGLGDVIQFARFIQPLAALGARVILEVFTPLKSLFTDFPGTEAVIGTGEPPPDFDRHCPLMSLPLALGITLEDLPRGVPYITALPDRIAHWRARLGEGSRPRIGFIWKGNPKFPDNVARSVPIAAISRLFSLDAEFVALQKEITPEERTVLARHPNVTIIGPELSDFSDTAAVLALCDHAAMSDTSVPHVAGAMGLDLTLLLPARADWRWLADRTDTPWYPSARLIRQAAPGEWDSVMETAKGVLEDKLAQTR